MTIGDSITLADLERDPDPILAQLREQAPVCWVPALEMWLVTRWDDVQYVEAHPELFTAATNPSFLARALGPNMLTCDPPDHSRIQQIMQPPFQAGGRSGRFASEELPAMADALLDDVDPLGFDVMAAYAQPLSAGSLATVLGLDHHGFDTMWRWCEGLCADIANFENDPALAALGERAKGELGEALAERIREDAEDDSAISWFVRHGATVDEIVNNVRLMISGGINEPRDGIGLVTWVLLTRPDLRSQVNEDPRLLRRLIEEVFRVYSPVGTVTRQATADVEVAGVAIDRGSLVAGVLRSVNLDEVHWDAPGEIRLDRREGPHAAFALGVHRCLGEWLGRQQVRVGVERLFARFPDLQLAPDGPHNTAGQHDTADQHNTAGQHDPVELHGFEFRGPRTVFVTTQNL